MITDKAFFIDTKQGISTFFRFVIILNMENPKINHCDLNGSVIRISLPYFLMILSNTSA